MTATAPAPEHHAASAPEHHAASVLEHHAASVLDRLVGSRRTQPLTAQERTR